MSLDSFDSLFVEQLKDLHSAERQLLPALKKMAKAAASEELKEAFELHRSQTEQQLERLEKVFELIQAKPGRHKCKAMEGLIEEGKEILEEDADPMVKDAALIAAAQRVEHYEIAGYGTARTYAEMLGIHEAADLLQQTLDEEKLTDIKLTEIAMSQINPAAMAAAE